MTLEEAKALLDTLHRDVLWDGTFGDSEVYWSPTPNGEEKARGYFSRDSDSVTIGPVTFNGADARTLQYCGKTSSSTRNDGG